jgi:hypothetical protein
MLLVQALTPADGALKLEAWGLKASVSFCQDLSVTCDKGQISARQVPCVTRDRRNTVVHLYGL